MLDMTWRQQWRHLLSKQTYKLSSSEMSKIQKKSTNEAEEVHPDNQEYVTR